jgi:phosphatidylglycerophosphate synthase
VRRLSDRLTPLLLPLPITPNQVSVASLLSGLAGAACFIPGSRGLAVAGGLLMILSYVLDNCDGDIARAKKLSSRLGHYLDSIVDWLVDTVFFVCLGIGTATAQGERLWLWLGLAAATGATVSYVLELSHDMRAARRPAAPTPPVAQDPLPTNAKEAFVYVFRELSRADFCFIVLALAAADVAWFLLIAGAIGAQVYWLSSLFVSWRRFHV